MVTIGDVARAAGVSPMTVSHVINDHPHVRVSTRAKVLEVIEKLDYRGKPCRPEPSHRPYGHYWVGGT